MKGKKIIRRQLLSFILILSICLMGVGNIEISKAATNQVMSDEAFFGKYSSGAWSQRGVLDYDGISGLQQVKNAVMSGNYILAKEALLNYYKTRETESFKHQILPTNERLNEVPLILDKFFVLGADSYAGSIVYGGNNEWKSVEVFENLSSFDFSDGLLTFKILARNKNQGDAILYTRESNYKPKLTVTLKNGTVKEYNPTKDTYIYGYFLSKYKNYGSKTTMEIKDIGDPYYGRLKKGYVTFPVEEAYEDIQSVEVSIYGRHDGSGLKEIVLYKTGNNGWIETGSGQLTYRNHSGKIYSYNDLSGGCTWRFPAEKQSTDVEYQWQVPRFGFVLPAVNKYRLTGNEEYAQGILDIIMDYIKDMGPAAGTSPRSLDVAGRVEAFIFAYAYLLKSESMDANESTEILKTIYAMGKFLTTSGSFFPQSNWGVHTNKCLLKVALSFDEFNTSEEWTRLAIDRYDQVSSRLIPADGVYNESTTSYAFGVAHVLVEQLKAAREKGYEFSDKFKTQFHKFAGYLVNVMYPNGLDINWGDSGQVDQSGIILSLAEFFDDATLKYVGTQGKEGTPPSYLSKEFGSNNMAILRSGWSVNDVYMFMNASVYGSHEHNSDDNAVLLYAYGKPLLVDSGAYTYGQDPISYYLARTNCAHNTIEADGKTYNKGGSREKFFTSTDLDLVKMSNTFKDINVKHQRNLFYLKPNVILVSDYLQSSSGQHQYTLNWHTPADQVPVVSPDGKQIATSSPDEASVKMIMAEDAVASIEGGYFSEQFYAVTKTKYGRFTVSGSGNKSLNTLLVPQKPGENLDVNLTRIPVNGAGEKASVLSAIIDGKENIVYISHDEFQGNRTAGSYTFNGKFAQLARKNNIYTHYYLDQGTMIKDQDIQLVNSPFKVNDLAVSYKEEQQTLAVESKQVVATTNSSIRLYAPQSVDTVQLNGESIEFQRDGDYILAVGLRSQAENYTKHEAIKDTYVRSGTYGNTNYGSADTLSVKNDVGSYARKAYIGFGEISQGMKTRLHFYVQSIGAVKPSLSIYGIDGSTFEEDTLTWNNQPTGGVLIGSIQLANPGWYELDVTDYIKTQGGENFAVRIESSVSGSEAWSGLESKEGQNKPYVAVYNQEPNLLVEWNFENNLNNTVSGKMDFNPQMGGGATYSTDSKVGEKSFSFDGIDDNITFDLPTVLQDNFTISMWVKQKNNTGRQIPMVNGNAVSSGYGMMLDGGNVRGIVCGKAFLYTNKNISKDTWVHQALVRESGQWKIYINGEQVLDNNRTEPSQPVGKLTIGSNGYGGEYFNGLMDSVKIYDKALKATEIQGLLQ